MGSTYITDMELAVIPTGTFVIQPAAGHAYVLEEVSSDVVFVGVNAGLPDIQINIDDGTHTTCILKLDPTTDAQKNRKLEIYLTNDLYATLENTGGGNANIGFFGRRVNVNNVRSRIVTAPNPGTFDVIPRGGEIWKVTEVGAETLGGDNNPDVTMILTDGTLVLSALCDETHDAKWDKAWNLILTHDNYLRLDSIPAADNDIALSIIRIPGTPFCGILDCVASNTIDIQPAAGQQAVITDISAEGWAGVAPLGGPDITVSLWEGVNLSNVMEAGSVNESAIWDRQFELRIHPAAYLRITDVSAADNQIAWSGMLERAF